MKHNLFLINENQDCAEWLHGLLQNNSTEEEWILVPQNLEELLQHDPCSESDVVLVHLPQDNECYWNRLKPLKQLAFNLPMIMIGEVEDQAMIEQFLNFGAQDYLVKSQITEMVFLQSLRYAIKRYKSLKEQQDSERKFQVIFDQTFELIWLLTPEGIITNINKTALEVIGNSAENLVGLPFWQTLKDHFYPGDQEKLKHSIVAVAHGELIRYEVDLKDALGKIISLDFSLKPVKDECDHVVLLLVEFRDISERKRVELENFKALEKTRELSELRTKFVTTVSHEFRTPLSTILLSSELIEKYSYKWSEEKKKIHTKRIRLAVKRMTELLEDVLLTGKAEARKMEFKPIPINLKLFCQKIIDQLQQHKGSDHRLILINQHPIPDVAIDEDMLKFILNQLLTNAIKYSPKGGTIKLEIMQDSQQIILQVQDQGIGIPETEQEKVFNDFYRGSNVGNISGTGLGLALVKRFVEEHQGKILINSKLGSGTQFIVRFPIQ